MALVQTTQTCCCEAIHRPMSGSGPSVGFTVALATKHQYTESDGSLKPSSPNVNSPTCDQNQAVGLASLWGELGGRCKKAEAQGKLENVPSPPPARTLKKYDPQGNPVGNIVVSSLIHYQNF